MTFLYSEFDSTYKKHGDDKITKLARMCDFVNDLSQNKVKYMEIIPGYFEPKNDKSLIYQRWNDSSIYYITHLQEKSNKFCESDKIQIFKKHNLEKLVRHFDCKIMPNSIWLVNNKSIRSITCVPNQ